MLLYLVLNPLGPNVLSVVHVDAIAATLGTKPGMPKGESKWMIFAVRPSELTSQSVSLPPATE
jgi:hypothetical protein